MVATANDIEQLPPELLRKGRFDEIFFVDLPTAEERENIFKIHLRKKNQDTNHFSFEELVRLSENFNGAEIEEAIKEAMFESYVANHDNPILENKYLIDAVKNTVKLYDTMKDNIMKLRSEAAKGIANMHQTSLQ